MADDDKKNEQELSEDEKLAAEWESAMEESGRRRQPCGRIGGRHGRSW